MDVFQTNWKQQKLPQSLFNKNNDLDKENYRPVSIFASCVKDHWKSHVHPNWKFHAKQVIKSANRFQEKP